MGGDEKGKQRGGERVRKRKGEASGAGTRLATNTCGMGRSSPGGSVAHSVLRARGLGWGLNYEPLAEGAQHLLALPALTLQKCLARLCAKPTGQSSPERQRRLLMHVSLPSLMR